MKRVYGTEATVWVEASTLIKDSSADLWFKLGGTWNMPWRIVAYKRGEVVVFGDGKMDGSRKIPELFPLVQAAVYGPDALMPLLDFLGERVPEIADWVGAYVTAHLSG